MLRGCGRTSEARTVGGVVHGAVCHGAVPLGARLPHRRLAGRPGPGIPLPWVFFADLAETMKNCGQPFDFDNKYPFFCFCGSVRAFEHFFHPWQSFFFGSFFIESGLNAYFCAKHNQSPSVSIDVLL